MLLLVFAFIVFAFLALGSLVFLACLPISKTRPYALSAALWCALWGPSAVAVMVVAGIGLATAAFLTKNGDTESLHAPRLLSTFGWSYLAIACVSTAALATGTAWLHQVLTRRLTLSLFRLYAAAVSAGIGSVFGWCLGLGMMWHNLRGYGWLFAWAFCMVALVAAFATFAYREARHLRGDAPKTFTWISPAEFTGTSEV